MDGVSAEGIAASMGLYSIVAVPSRESRAVYDVGKLHAEV